MADVPINWESLLDEIPEGQGQKYDVLPVGPYNVRVESTEVSLSSNGNQMIKTQFVVIDGEHKGRKIWDTITFALKSTNSMGVTIEQLGILGISRNWLATNGPSVSQIATKIKDKELTVKVGHRDYNGETYADVKRYLPLTSGKSDPF